MLGRTQTVTVKEYALPLVAGKFTLTMASERQVLGIFNKNGANILLCQEESGTETADSSFEAVESGTEVELAASWRSADVYLGSYQEGGKLLHLFGVKSIESQGGPASFGGAA
jgi:hypothetical protein